MQGHEPGQRAAGLGGLVGRVVEDRLLQVDVLVVGDVAGQHVLDEALLDGLAHRIQVERLVPAVSADITEQLQSPTLGRRGEREERQVRLVAPRRHRLGEQRLRIGHLGVGVDLRLGRAQHPPQFCSRFAGLRRVRLVHDHRIVALGQRPDLVEHERELLQRCHDDAGLLTGQRRGELRRVLVDPLDHPQGVLELVDGVLQLPVEDAKVSDDHHLVEHLGIAGGVQRRQPVRQPGDRVRLARPRRMLHQDSCGPPRAAWRRHPGAAPRPTDGTAGRSPPGGPSSPSTASPRG